MTDVFIRRDLDTDMHKRKPVEDHNRKAATFKIRKGASEETKPSNIHSGLVAPTTERK